MKVRSLAQNKDAVILRSHLSSHLLIPKAHSSRDQVIQNVQGLQSALYHLSKATDLNDEPM